MKSYLASCPFCPPNLAVVFGVFILPVVFAIAYVFMYVPMQLGSGRLVYCLCPHLMTTRCCRPRANRTERQEEEDEEGEATGQNSSSGASPDPAAEQAGLMALKAMGTLFFALFALSVYFTPFFLGRAWGALVDELYALPSMDWTQALSVLGNLRVALAWCAWVVHWSCCDAM